MYVQDAGTVTAGPTGFIRKNSCYNPDYMLFFLYDAHFCVYTRLKRVYDMVCCKTFFFMLLIKRTVFPHRIIPDRRLYQSSLSLEKLWFYPCNTADHRRQLSCLLLKSKLICSMLFFGHRNQRGRIMTAVVSRVTKC